MTETEERDEAWSVREVRQGIFFNGESDVKCLR